MEPTSERAASILGARIAAQFGRTGVADDGAAVRYAQSVCEASLRRMQRAKSFSPLMAGLNAVDVVDATTMPISANTDYQRSAAMSLGVA